METPISDVTATADQAVDDSSSDDRAAVEELASAFGKEAPPEPEAEPPVDTTEPVAKEVVVEEGVTEPDITEEPSVEPGSTEHKLQSWLGRKLAKRDEDLKAEIGTMLKELITEIKPAAEAIPEPIELPDLGEDLDEVVTTKREVLELQERSQRARTAREQTYWNTYSATLGKQAAQDKLDPDMVKAVAEELDSNLRNPMSNKDPEVSALLNYRQAVLNVLRRTPVKEEKVVPVSGAAPISATGVITSQTTDTKPEGEIQLDAESKRLVNAFNLSPEKVKAIVKPKK